MNCSVLVSIADVSIGSGFGQVLPFCQLFTAARFSVQAFSVALSHHGGYFLLFNEPFALCVGFRLRSFDTVSEPDLSYLKGLCGLLFCFLAALCRLNTTSRWSLPCGVSVSALSHVHSWGDKSQVSGAVRVPVSSSKACWYRSCHWGEDDVAQGFFQNFPLRVVALLIPHA